MYVVYMILSILGAIVSFVSSGGVEELRNEIILEFAAIESEEDTTSSNNLKAKAYADEYFNDAEAYKENYYDDKTDLDSYYKAVENYEKSVYALMAEGVNTEDYYYDLCVTYNNLGIMQIIKWQSYEDIETLNAGVENLEKSFEYSVESEEATITQNLGYGYYSQWCCDFNDVEARDLALEYYEQSYYIEPDRARINNLLGLYYIDVWEQYGYEDEYYDIAEEYLERALELEEGYENAIDNLSYLYQKKAELDTEDDEDIKNIKDIDSIKA